MLSRRDVFLYTFVLYVIQNVQGNVLSNKEKERKLFQNYSPLFKPRKDLSQSVSVNITFHLNVIAEINERLQTIRFIAWFDVSWIDEFLILSEDVESLLISKEDIWNPDLSIYDSVENPQTISDGQYVVLFQNDHVSWYPGNEYVIRCNIDIRRYPFDAQVCKFRVGAWHNTVWTQNFIVPKNGFDMSGFTVNGEWLLTETTVEPLFLANYNNSLLQYNISLKRRPLHPLLNTLVPVVMLAFLNTLVFLLPANSGEKMTLCISVLLSFTVFLTVFNDTMPKMSTTISYLSIYLVVQLGMSVFGIVMSIYVWRMKDGEKNVKHELFHVASPRNDQEEITSTMFANSDDVKTRCFSLRLPVYKDGVEDNITAGESSGMNGCQGCQGCQGHERNYHFSFSNYSNGKSRWASTVFPSSRTYSVDEAEKVSEPIRNIKQLDRIMFLITFCIVLGSTIILFIALML